MYFKVVSGFLSNVMSTLSFKIGNFKTTYPYLGKTNQKLNDGKGVSAHQKVSEFFQKIPYEKIQFLLQKNEKYLKLKNDFKKH